MWMSTSVPVCFKRRCSSTDTLHYNEPTAHAPQAVDFKKTLKKWNRNDFQSIGLPTPQKPLIHIWRHPQVGIWLTTVLALFSCSGSYCLVHCYVLFYSFKLLVSRSWGFPTWTGTELHICVMFQNVKSLLLCECLYFFLAPSASLWFQEKHLEIYWVLWMYCMCISSWK